MIEKYIDSFFDELEVFDDLAKGRSNKAYLKGSIMEFLGDGNRENAMNVYVSFFDSYRIVLEGESNQFIDLLDVLRNYEEKASTLLDRHRDHYVHSVNVFILGLCIYIRNGSFRKAFDKVGRNKEIYKYSYDTRHEEFLYRWGIASLFHDVGYPVEITAKQIGKFVSFITDTVDGERRVKAGIDLDTFEDFNSIPEVIPKEEFTKEFSRNVSESSRIDLLKPLDLIALKIHKDFHVDLETARKSLDRYFDAMKKSGIADHGFFSAIIVLKWYGFLIQKCGYNPNYFFYPVVDCASAILLHNYYRNVLMKEPFRLGKLSPELNPVAYLLILCDELQEWNRRAYGTIDRKRASAGNIKAAISNREISLTYISQNGMLPDSFAAEKTELLDRVLDIGSIFPGGIHLSCEGNGDTPAGLQDEAAADDTGTDMIVPRPLLENLEKLARMIHQEYNARQLERYPERKLEYPTWESLPDDLKYSNMRQARRILDKLRLIGCTVMPKGSGSCRVSRFTDGEIELLAEAEHDFWVRERLSQGWKYGAKKDVDKKISPYLVPYEQLDEEAKQLDRDTVMNIIPLLESIDLEVCRVSNGRMIAKEKGI